MGQGKTLLKSALMPIIAESLAPGALEALLPSPAEPKNTPEEIQAYKIEKAKEKRRRKAALRMKYESTQTQKAREVEE